MVKTEKPVRCEEVAMAIFGNLFDFNHDGKLDSLEKAAEMDFFLEQVDRDNRTLRGGCL